MKGFERLFCLLSVLAAMAILLLGVFGASEAFGGGLPVPLWSPSMNEWLDLPGVRLGCNYSNHLGANEGSAWVSFTLKNHNVDNCGWGIYTDKLDTSHFYAYLSASGSLVGPDQLRNVFETQRQEVNYHTRAGVNLYEFSELGIGYYFDGIEGLNEDPILLPPVYKNGYTYLSANLRLSPARISRSSLDYNEYPAYEWNPTDNVPYPTEDTRWSAQCSFEGYFLAATPLLAKEMGAPFVQTVPEPSTIALLVSFGLAGIVAIIRRRWA